ncbi:hypothetical protein Hdeb2414_s0026g00677781 [Helianthus debilis subsp. tardiflorus]
MIIVLDTLPNTKYILKATTTSYQLPATSHQPPATFAKHTLCGLQKN